MQKREKKEITRRLLWRLLGELPEGSSHPQSRLIKEEERDGYRLETLVLELNGLEPVPAYFVKPKNARDRRPTILYNHSHGGDYEAGKEKLIKEDPRTPPYAEVLTQMGFNVLCIDHWCFGERRGRSESALFKEMLWQGRVLWGMMVFDSVQAVNYLTTRNDVDKERIGTMGKSMGSTMAWWLAALDERIKVCVDICCLTDFHALLKAQGLDGHGIYYYVPNLLKHFTTAQINALIAPRPHLSLAGIYDPLTPPDGLERIDKELKRVYQEAGAENNWRLSSYPTGHLETAAMRQEALVFLKEHL